MIFAAWHHRPRIRRLCNTPRIGYLGSADPVPYRSVISSQLDACAGELVPLAHSSICDFHLADYASQANNADNADNSA